MVETRQQARRPKVVAKKPAAKPKTSKKVKPGPKPKDKEALIKTKTVDKFTQVQNVCLEHAKNRISHAVDTWLKSRHEFDPAENEKDAYLNMVHELYEELKIHIEDDQLKLLKLKQIELEFQAVLTFTMASTYLTMCKFQGFARSFRSLTNLTVSLIFSIASDIDLANQLSITYPQWKNWNNVVDAINAGFKAERSTIENFEKLQTLVPENQRDILDKKINITKRIKNLMDLLGNAKRSEDFYDIDKKLLPSSSSRTQNIELN